MSYKNKGMSLPPEIFKNSEIRILFAAFSFMIASSIKDVDLVPSALRSLQYHFAPVNGASTADTLIYNFFLLGFVTNASSFNL
jgi:hypothetical protein